MGIILVGGLITLIVVTIMRLSKIENDIKSNKEKLRERVQFIKEEFERSR